MSVSIFLANFQNLRPQKSNYSFNYPLFKEIALMNILHSFSLHLLGVCTSSAALRLLQHLPGAAGQVGRRQVAQKARWWWTLCSLCHLRVDASFHRTQPLSAKRGTADALWLTKTHTVHRDSSPPRLDGCCSDSSGSVKQIHQEQVREWQWLICVCQTGTITGMFGSSSKEKVSICKDFTMRMQKAKQVLHCSGRLWHCQTFSTNQT